MTPPSPPPGTTPAPTTERPLTVADRAPQVGDRLLSPIQSGEGDEISRIVTGEYPRIYFRLVYPRHEMEASKPLSEIVAARWYYTSRADGGPITVPVT